MCMSKIQCVTLGVDCVPDPKGPGYLGFQFDVPLNVSNATADFIRYTCKLNRIPLVDIYTCGMVVVEQGKVATAEKINAELLKKAAYLRTAAKKTGRQK